MRIGMVLTPPDEHHLRLAAQVGVTDFVSRYAPVETSEMFDREYSRVASFGLKLSVVEGYIPFDDIIRGGEKQEIEIENVKRLIVEMGARGVEILCYNWMPNNDWTRTGFDVPTRGGALTNEFKLSELKANPFIEPISAQALWKNLETFLREVVPIAEKCNVKLAMHPDDPPLDELLGSAQIMHNPEDYERLFQIAPSPFNGMCLCSGTFSSLGENVPALVHRFGNRIHYAHLRDVRGTVPHFIETFHDDGQMPFAEVVRALHEIGFRGPLRPDHVPKMDGEEGPATGYTMLGRLFAVGYLRGLMHAVESEGAAREIAPREYSQVVPMPHSINSEAVPS